MEVLLELSTSGKKQLAEGQGADVPGVVLIFFFFPMNLCSQKLWLRCAMSWVMS